MYRKLEPVEHILLRPDTYVGNTKEVTNDVFVAKLKSKVEMAHIKYVPALLKIIDEIIVNATDNAQRRPAMTRMDVSFDRKTHRITVTNNGKGIPVDMHKTEKVHIPELVFGTLLTGSNFNDNEGRLTGGRHGYGAKLTNIFSSEFTVETVDSSKGLHYKQTWQRNMSVRGDPIITPIVAEEDSTTVSFVPDLQQFGLKKLSLDFLSLIRRRVIDVAGCYPAANVSLNGKVLKVASFADYCVMYPDVTKSQLASTVLSGAKASWEVAVTKYCGVNQVSFVNGIPTPNGGTHVAHVLDYVSKALSAHINSAHKLPATPAAVKPFLTVFVKAMVEDPSFASQSKEQLTTPRSNLPTLDFPANFIKQVISKTNIVKDVVASMTTRQADKMNRTSSQLTARTSLSLSFPHLEDANFAGGPKSRDCTLIITEGLSAKALAVAGLSVVGRDKFGVFPLRGKIRNVRGMQLSKLAENKELVSLQAILGLRYGKEPELSKLRYGKIMLMCDQDHDGSHIKGLFINLLLTLWPLLVHSNKVLQQFVTPILKATKGKDSLAFYTQQQYDLWRKQQGAAADKWRIKYYKGLGTSTSAEAVQYFSDMPRHQVDFKHEGVEDDMLIDMIFNTKKADDRKTWILKSDPLSFVDTSNPVVTISDFVDKELVHFSYASNVRSIPSVIDGLKPSQRKVLFGSFKKKLVEEIKVIQLAGFIGEHTAYHHGEASLHQTIIRMAQTFVGSNNIALLEPCGQFGTRLAGGEDCASPRYIFTHLDPLSRKIFPEADDAVLNMRVDDGVEVEPVHYIPIIPMTLVNGAEGIGTGWATSVPLYHPVQVLDNVLCLLRKKPMKAMVPWYRGFRGTVELMPMEEDEKTESFVTRGVVTKPVDSGDTAIITELPVGSWTNNYKEFLSSLASKESVFSDLEVVEQSTQESVYFELRSQALCNLEGAELYETLGLTSSVRTSNMMLFDKDYKICHFSSPLEIIEHYFSPRLELYAKRKAHQLQVVSADIRKLDNRVRFLTAVKDGSLPVTTLTRVQTEKMLKAKGFDKLLENASETNPSYNYLLNMRMHTLTTDNRLEMEKKLSALRDSHKKLTATSPEKIWETELLALRPELVARCELGPASRAEP